MHEVTIYADGACSGNGRGQAPGGWAAIIAHAESGRSRELSGGELDTTNQRMEILAVIEGLRALTKPCTVTVRSDSAYVVNCICQGWYRKWRRNGWLNSKKDPVANQDLWELLLDCIEKRGHTVSFEKVQGHADLLGRASSPEERLNQRCDELAVAAVPV